MSLLIVQLPPRARLLAGGASSRAGAAAGLQYAHVLSPDGRQVEREGRAPLALLPRATSTVLVLAPGDVAFHRLRVPKAPAARLRPALAGLLEDQLLDEPEALHLALAPGAQAGAEAWLAVTDRAALRAQVEAFEAAGHAVDRIVPARAPGASTATLDVFGPVDDHEPPEQAWLVYGDATGLRSLRWDSRGRPGPLVQALLPEPLPPELLCRAAPALVQASEAWLGRPVEVQPLAQQLLEAARGDAAAEAGGAWNLRQFEFAPRHRGASWLRDTAARLRSPAWRPVRWGLAGLVAAQLLGLNAWAWQERSALAERRAGLQQILRATHPQVRAILDAPLQMQRENETLRAAAGRAGDNDLEPLLQAAASAWPEQLPVQSLRYENARLTLGAPGLDEAAIGRLRSSLQPAGWRVEGAAGSLTLQRVADGAAR